MVVKLVHKELVKLLGGDGQTSEIRFEINKPTVIMLVGLQGKQLLLLNYLLYLERNIKALLVGLVIVLVRLTN